MNNNAAPAATTGRSRRQLRRKRNKNTNVIAATAARAPRDMVRNTANAITPVPVKKSVRRGQVRLERTRQRTTIKATGERRQKSSDPTDLILPLANAAQSPRPFEG